MHIAGDARNIERLATIVALDEADRLGDQLAGFEAAADAQRRLQSEADFGHHVRKLQLHELVGGKRLAELLAIERVAPRRMVAGFGGAH